jgi:hypothetical protein
MIFLPAILRRVSGADIKATPADQMSAGVDSGESAGYSPREERATFDRGALFSLPVGGRGR